MAGENRELDAKEISVGRLLHDGDYEFVIPEYQRPYAWGTEESLQLLADLVGALDVTLMSRTSSALLFWLKPRMLFALRLSTASNA